MRGLICFDICRPVALVRLRVHKWPDSDGNLDPGATLGLAAAQKVIAYRVPELYRTLIKTR